MTCPECLSGEGFEVAWDGSFTKEFGVTVDWRRRDYVTRFVEVFGRAGGAIGRPCHNEMEFSVRGVADFWWLWGGGCGMVRGVTCDSC